MKLANGNMVHAQGIGKILYHFPNCYIIYPVGKVYYCPGQSYNTISSGALKRFVVSQKFMSKPLEHCEFFDLHGLSWRSPYQNQNNLDHIQIEIVKVSHHRDKNIVFLYVCFLSEQNISHDIYQCFGFVSISITKQMA